MARVRILVASLLVFVVMAGCVSPGSSSGKTVSKAAGQIISGPGQVRYVELEGGFYGIVAPSGKYEPINLPTQFQVNKKDIVFKARLRPDVSTSHMWGKPVEILEIK